MYIPQQSDRRCSAIFAVPGKIKDSSRSVALHNVTQLVYRLKHMHGLRQHLKSHREDFAKCTICGKVLRNKNSMLSHRKRAHDDQRHRCTICDKLLATPKSLQEHIAGHTGEDLYNCPYCEKSFKSNANMYTHRKRAHLAEWTRDFAADRRRNPVEKIATASKR